MANETLHCERGNHPWTRISARGRKPKSCNSPLCATPNPELVPAESLSETTESTDPNPSMGRELTASLSGTERAARLVERMARLHERDAQRRKPKPQTQV